MRLILKVFLALLTLSLILTGNKIFGSKEHFPRYTGPIAVPTRATPSSSQVGSSVLFPLVMNAPRREPIVNIPFFAGPVPMNQMAIFWFGQATPNENYADVRLGYTADVLTIHIAVIDRRLWCSTNASSGTAQSDSLELYLNTSAQPVYTLPSTAFRITGQLGSWNCEESWTAYQGSSAGWHTAPLSFTASTGWRGNATNDEIDDRGWTADIRVPFSSLGLSAAPATGTVWKLAVVLHDRNDATGNIITQKQWPDNLPDEFKNDQPETWANLSFGIPVYNPPPAVPSGQVTVRNRLNGAYVPDAQVGGGTVCGDGLDFWTQWGQTTYLGSEDHDQVNIQNQGDIADWPCYSKYYVTFPLNSIPAGKVILSAQLRLHQFGNSGGASDAPPRSLIQVFTVDKDWSAGNLTWNNAPPMTENVSQAWVDPISNFPGWPGVLRTWDVSRAVANAYATRVPLRLALYSADEGYHSGKYFISSYTGDWNAEARPELQILIGNP